MVTLLLPPGGESSYSFVFYSLVSSLPRGTASVIFLIPVYFITEWQKLSTVTHADHIFPLIPGHDLTSTRHLLCLNLACSEKEDGQRSKLVGFFHGFACKPFISLFHSSQLRALWILKPQPA